MRIKACRASLCESVGMVLVDSPDAPMATPRPSVSALLPREHGSWALALEPLVLASLAAPSWRGAAFAAAGLALFLMRRPWQVATQGRDRARVALARRVLVALGALVLLAIGGAVAEAGRALLAVLTLAALAGGCFAWADARRQARGVMAEVAGASCFAAWAAGVVLCAGRGDGWGAALVVGAFAWSRALTSILPVRVFVRRRKGQRVSATVALSVAGACAIVGISTVGVVHSWVPALWLVVFLLRTLWLVGPQRPAWSARTLGITEAVVGAAAMISTGIALS